MRLIGMILALGVIVWILMQATGGGETAIPEGHLQALDKAKGVEQSVQDAAAARMRQMDEQMDGE